MQRPQTSVATSRRSTRNGRCENGEAILHPGSARPATPGRNVLARPPSSFAALNHGNRLGTIGSGDYATIGGGERPITQYGVAGMRPGTGRGMTRQIQDKRYYLSLLQLKIRELTQEIAAIHRDIEAQTKERAKFHHYDKLAKDLASELTDLQSDLADYNTVVDKFTSNVEKAEIEGETRELSARNEANQLRIEGILDERLKREREAREISRLLENRTRRGASLVSNMAAAERAKFESLRSKLDDLNRTLAELQSRLDALNATEANLNREIDGSPLKREAARLQLELFESLEARQRLSNEQRNDVPPEDEKRAILSKVRTDNSQISAAEARLSEINKRFLDGERRLEGSQAENGQSEAGKRSRFDELRRREAAIDDFMVNFEASKRREGEKLERLQRSVVENLTNVSRHLMNAAENSPDLREEAILSRTCDIIPDPLFHHDNSEKNEVDEIARLSTLRRVKIEMEILAGKIESESKRIAADIGNESSGDSNDSEADFRQRALSLKAENEKLTAEGEKVLAELREIRMKFEGREIDGDDLTREINDLQVREADLKAARKLAEDSIEKERNSTDFREIKRNALKSVEFYNGSLRENLRNVFAG